MMPAAIDAAALAGAWSVVGRTVHRLEQAVSPAGAVAVASGAVSLLAGAAWSLSSRRRRPSLVAIVDPYRVVPSRARPAPLPDVLALPPLRRLSRAIGEAVVRARPGRWLAGMLERSGSRVEVGEVVVAWLVLGVLLAATAWILSGLFGAVVVVVVTLVGTPATLRIMVERRARLFASQLPDVLKLTASSLRAGFSLLQGLDAVAKQLREPSRSELQRVLAEAMLGRPVEDALEDAASRIGNGDFAESVAAVRIQQEAGGNLAALFDTLAATMQQRLRLRREVRTLTSEGRMSAYVLGVLPPALGAFILAVNRPYALELVHSFPGKVMLSSAIVLEVVGFAWMHRIVRVEA